MERYSNCMYKDVCDFDMECSSGCLRYSITKYMLIHSNIPKSKWGVNQLIPEECDVEAFMQLSEIRSNIVDFVNSGKNLYLYSPICGNGKTTWSIKLMLQYFNDVWEFTGYNTRGIFINVPTFLYNCKAAINSPNEDFEKLKNLIFKVDLVIWDDIASTERMSDYDYNTLLAFIDKRAIEEKSNIVTSNITPDNLSKYAGSKLASRLLNGYQIELKGKDRR